MSVGLIWCNIMRDAVVPVLCKVKNRSEKFTKDHANEFRAQDVPKKVSSQMLLLDKQLYFSANFTISYSAST